MPNITTNHAITHTNLACFPWFYFKSWTLQRMSRMTKHLSKAGKVDPSDRVTLTVKFACKPEG